MEQWDDFKYGPLQIYSTAGRLVKFGEVLVGLGRAEFTVLLRLMACRGGVVSKSMLTRDMISDCMMQLAVCRLRQFFQKHFGDSVYIETRNRFGYKLSLAGELFLGTLYSI